MTLDGLYERLRADARAKGSVFGQVWHEADIDGHHLYMADTSFGDGPVFYFDHHGWQSPAGEWLVLTKETSDDHLREALAWAAQAEWRYRLEVLDPHQESRASEREVL